MGTWMYHERCPEGRIFADGEEIPYGWVDSPAKLGKPYNEVMPDALGKPEPSEPEEQVPDQQPKRRRGRPPKNADAD